MRSLLCWTFLLLLAAAPASAGGGTVYVANDGLDAPGCGTAADPCRSITQGLAAAADGDTVLVGPGTYGDVGSNGTLTDPGDENPGGACADCMLLVAKSVAVVSRDGAASTFVTGRELPAGFDVVRLTAAGASFGRKNQGFTVIGTPDVDGVAAQGAGSILAGDVVARARFGIEVSGEGSLVADVRLVRNTIGAYLSGTGVRVERSAAVANDADGFWLAGPDQVAQQSVSTGNRYGFTIQSTGALVSRVVAVGNRSWGIIGEAAPIQIVGSSLFGNSAETGAPNPNCGLIAVAAGISAAGNFWGSAAGPGADPADEVCGGEAGSAVTEPFATHEAAAKLRAIR